MEKSETNCQLSGEEWMVIRNIQQLVCQNKLDVVLDYVDPEFLAKALIAMGMQLLYLELGDMGEADDYMRKFALKWWVLVIEETEIAKGISKNYGSVSSIMENN